MKKLAYGLLVMMAFAVPAVAQQAETIGHIQTLQGSASIQRGDAVLPGAVGAAIHSGDRVRTGKPGAVGIVLIDDTSISLGSGSELSFKDYAFDPKEGRFSLVMQMMKGTFAYLSGLIGKLAPNAIQLQLPDATIAVRGTKLLIEIQE